MLIDLGKEALESIVKDGVKEMMGHIDNSNIHTFFFIRTSNFI